MAGLDESSRLFKSDEGKWLDNEEWQPYNEIGWPIFMPDW
jgi:hypothetical protein